MPSFISVALTINMMIHILLRLDLGLFRIKTETLPRTLDTAVYSILSCLFRAGKAVSLNAKQLIHSENQVRATPFRGCHSARAVLVESLVPLSSLTLRTDFRTFLSRQIIRY